MRTMVLRSLVACSVFACSAGLGSGMGRAAMSSPAIAARPCPEHVVATQHINPGSARLSGVAAVSATDVWAVGGVSTTTVVTASNGITSTVTLPFIEHYDGRTWCAVDTHNLHGSPLVAVAAVNAHDAWAVGQQIEHWDGQHWTVIAASQPAYTGQEFTSVSASSHDNVWAAGDGLVERWDGTRWQEVPLPDTLQLAARFSGQATVVTLSRSDTWLVGQSSPDVGPGLVSHWDGHQWQDFGWSPEAKRWEDMGLPRAAPPARYSADLRAACDPLNAYQFDLNTIVAFSHNDVWIGGNSDARPDTCPLLYHWDGDRLHEVWLATTARDVAMLEQAIRKSSDSHVVAGWSLTAMAGAGPNDIWAMTGVEDHALHWDGHTWHEVAAWGGPTPALPLGLSSMVVASSTDAWAVGGVHASPGSNFHWDGRQWRAVSMQPAG